MQVIFSQIFHYRGWPVCRVLEAHGKYSFAHGKDCFAHDKWHLPSAKKHSAKNFSKK